ncbi:MULTISPECIES: hypothetical protein [unclassified Peribacillus]|uniref:hypothetical protein n=1 Tax=unclassified Peribacillus TaxID=2675266 RepID=UPI00366CC597
MNLGQFLIHIQSLTEESPTLEQVTNYANDGIAKLNSKAGAIFPFLESTPNYEFPISETFVRTILVPFVAGRIKTQDSSQFEYSDLYGEFKEGLSDFIANYPIPEEFKSHQNQTYNPETGKWETDVMSIELTYRMG